MATWHTRRLHRFLVLLLVPTLASACGDQLLGGYRGTSPADASPAEDGAAADDAGGSFGLGQVDGSVDGTPCGSSANGTAQGCEFYSVAPWAWTFGSCFAAMLVNPGTAPVTIQVEYGASSLDVSSMARIPNGTGKSITYDPLPSTGLPPGKLGILFLARNVNPDYIGGDCPAGVTPGVTNGEPSISDTGRGTAFHIKTSGPVAAFDIYPYAGSVQEMSSASLLLPVRSWGTSYVAVDPYQADPVLNDDFESCEPFVEMVASQDDTHVTIRPAATTYADHGVASVAAGMATTFSLAKGEVLQLTPGPWGTSAHPATDRVMGSPVTSDKPIAVIGGAPGWYGANNLGPPQGPTHQCETSHQQIPPTTALGSEYAVGRYRDRVAAIHETVPWTIMGLADGTTLTFDPAPPAGAPTSLGQGQFAIFSSSDGFTVRSQDDQHPFYVAEHMNGFWSICPTCKNNSPPEGGEPEFVEALPPAQWLTQYTFITDPTFADTNLVFVRKHGSDGAFHDVTLDCAGAITGWTAIGTMGTYEYARADLAVSGAAVGKCNNGAHVASSAAPFSLTIWAWDTGVAYAYPAGGGLGAINSVPLK